MSFSLVVSGISILLRKTSWGSALALLFAGSLALLALTGKTQAQTTFLRIQDPANPITTNATSGHYTGAAWIDYDNDGDLDLFVVDPSSHELYQNDGAGNFTKIITGILVTDFAPAGRGMTWGDYDNDGDLDCFVGGAPSVLYRQDSAGVFTKITTGEIATLDSRGWSAGCADYDSDGFLDLVISHPAGFVPGGAATPNHLYHNDGPPNYTFTKIDTGVIVTGLAAYTHGSWYDYDDDGDIDLFMAKWPSGNADTTTAVAINQTLSISESGVVFDVGNRFGAGSLSTQFFSRTSENVSAWSWDFGNGESSTDASPVHDYTTPGLYSVTVEIQSDDGQFSFTRSDYLGVHADTVAPLDAVGPAGTTVAVDVSIRHFVPITGMVIPFAWSSGFNANANGISFSGLRANGFTATLV